MWIYYHKREWRNKAKKFKEDMALLNLRLHRAINPDNISYVQLSSNYYPQGVHWERNIKSKGLDKTKKEAYIVHFNCTIGWSNIDEMHAIIYKTLIIINEKFGICYGTICGTDIFQQE